MRYRQKAEPTWLFALHRREHRGVFRLHDLISEPSRRRHGLGLDRSLAQALREAVVESVREHAAHEVRWRLVTVRRLIAREISLGRTLCGAAAWSQQKRAMNELRRPLAPLLATT